MNHRNGALTIDFVVVDHELVVVRVPVELTGNGVLIARRRTVDALRISLPTD